MERVAFLIEESGERISAMLNPESVTLRRSAGVRTQASSGGSLSGKSLSDDPLLFTGGGRTELEMNLLFDVNVAGSTITTKDVRELTGPFWRLAENAQSDSSYAQPPLARFVWGKAWNMLGVVVAVGERFEQFTAAGEPQRAWLRMRFVRVAELPPATVSDLATENSQLDEMIETPDGVDSLLDMLPGNSAESFISNNLNVPDEETAAHQIVGGETISELSARYLDDPSNWRWLAWWNRILHPLKMAAGSLLRVPPSSYIRK